MPDITMCVGVTKKSSCHMKSTCYRYTATPDEYRQSWFSEVPLKEDQTCEHYLPLTITKKKASDVKGKAKNKKAKG